MSSYCLKCTKNTESINPRVLKTSKGKTMILSKCEVSVIKKVKSAVPWTYVINDLNGKEINGTLYERELQKINEQGFMIEKVIKRKGNQLRAKWKGYDNSFNSWINKKHLIE